MSKECGGGKRFAAGRILDVIAQTSLDWSDWLTDDDALGLFSFGEFRHAFSNYILQIVPFRLRLGLCGIPRNIEVHDVTCLEDGPDVIGRSSRLNGVASPLENDGECNRGC